MTKSSSLICFQPLRADQLLFCTPTARWLLKVNSSSCLCIRLEVTNNGKTTPNIQYSLGSSTSEAGIRLIFFRRHCRVNIKFQHHNSVIIKTTPTSCNSLYTALKRLDLSGNYLTILRLSRAANNFNSLSSFPAKAQRWGGYKKQHRLPQELTMSTENIVFISLANRILTCTVWYILFDVN